jgi:hypothetical protein
MIPCADRAGAGSGGLDFAPIDRNLPAIPPLRPITRLREPWRTDEWEVGLDRGQPSNLAVLLIATVARVFVMSNRVVRSMRAARRRYTSSSRVSSEQSGQPAEASKGRCAIHEQLHPPKAVPSDGSPHLPLTAVADHHRDGGRDDYLGRGRPNSPAILHQGRVGPHRWSREEVRLFGRSVLCLLIRRIWIPLQQPNDVAAHSNTRAAH